MSAGVSKIKNMYLSKFNDNVIVSETCTDVFFENGYKSYQKKTLVNLFP